MSRCRGAGGQGEEMREEEVQGKNAGKTAPWEESQQRERLGASSRNQQ